MFTDRKNLVTHPAVSVVVCPTEYGGQIEHAFDTSVALSLSPYVSQTLLITRPGAKSYLQYRGPAAVTIREVLPRRRLKGSRFSNTVRPLLQLLDLLKEHMVIRGEVAEQAGQRPQLLLDASRYPFPRMLARKSQKARLVLFVHNAQPHVAAARRSLREKFLRRLERLCIDHVDLAVTHGENQLKTVSSLTSTRVVSVGLPESSFLDHTGSLLPPAKGTHAPYALCIGELRENKGIETAIQAAGSADLELLVAGKSQDRKLASVFQNLAVNNPNTQIRDEFLEKDEFDALIAGSMVVVLPYTHFDAQSGVLAKAMKAGRSVVASDLASLREQAANYSKIEFVPVGDVGALAAAMTKAFSANAFESPAHSASDPTVEWNRVVDAIFDND